MFNHVQCLLFQEEGSDELETAKSGKQGIVCESRVGASRLLVGELQWSDSRDDAGLVRHLCFTSSRYKAAKTSELIHP